MPLDPIGVIYRSCDPDLPLPVGDSRYVLLAEGRGETDLAGISWRDQLARDIRRLQKPTTFLIAGFTGDGKSTEFARLQHDLNNGQPKLAALHIDTSLYLNPYDYSFTDVLLAIASEAARQLEADYAVRLRPSYWMQRMEEVRRKLLSDVELKQADGKAKIGAFEISASLALKARNNDQIREQLWNALATEKTTLVQEFRDLLDRQARTKLKTKGYEDVVLIVDWLEKLQPARKDTDKDPLEELFLMHAGLFQSMGVHLVLTLPLPMAYSTAQQRLTLAYNGPPIQIHAVRVSKIFPSAQRNAGKQALLSLLEGRFANAPEGSVPFDQVFPDESLAEEIVEFSGGHPRTLLILLRECCSFRDSLPLTRQAFEGAKRKMIEAVSRQVREDWYELLAEVHLTHRIKNDLNHQQMLLNLCILSYRNREPLYDVVPAILELKRFRDALRRKRRASALGRSTRGQKKRKS